MTKATIKGPWDVHVHPSNRTCTIKKCPGLLLASKPGTTAYASRTRKERLLEDRVWHFDDIDTAVSYVFQQHVDQCLAMTPPEHPYFGGLLAIASDSDSPDVREEIERVHQRFKVLDIIGTKGKGT
jgi:hypothetical protein